MTTYTCNFDPADCRIELPPAAVATCAADYEIQESEICDIWMTAPGGPKPSDWTNPNSYPVDNSGAWDPATTMRQLLVQGDKPLPEVREVSLGKDWVVQTMLVHTINASITDVRNYNLIRSLQQAEEVVVWFRTIDGLMVGGPDGIQCKANRAGNQFSRGQGALLTGEFQLQWAAPCDPPAAIADPQPVAPIIESTTISQGTAAGAEAITITMPATRPDGDTYYLLTSSNGGFNDITLPAGWTEIHRFRSDGIEHVVASRTGASEPASYTANMTQAGDWAAFVVRASQVTAGQAAVDSTGILSGTNIETPALTIAGGSRILRLGSILAATTITTAGTELGNLTQGGLSCALTSEESTTGDPAAVFWTAGNSAPTVGTTYGTT